MEPYFESPNATLYVGDCRDVIPNLPRGSVDLLLTDPPYGVNWQSNFRKEAFAKIAGDDGTLNVPELLASVTVGKLLRNKRHVYVFGFTAEELAPMGLSATADLVWDKMILGSGDLSQPWAPSHERVTFGTYYRSRSEREGGGGRLSARLRQGSVLRYPRPNGTGVRRHPTEKPVTLMRALVEASTVPGDLVFDPFAGVGSSLIAAVLSGRKAIGVELEQKYADITIDRLNEAEDIAKRMNAA